MASYMPFIQAGITALSDRAGGVGPHADPYQPSKGHINKWMKWGLKDAKAYRQGGINDPRLDYLGFGPGWQSEMRGKIRSESQGEQTAAEQRLGDAYRGYAGGGTANSGRFIQNLGRLRADRATALDAAMRDLEIENYNIKNQNFMNMQGNSRAWQGQLAGQYMDAEQMAYQTAYNRWQSRKQHYRTAGEAMNRAIGSSAMGSSMGNGGGGGIPGMG